MKGKRGALYLGKRSGGVGWEEEREEKLCLGCVIREKNKENKERKWILFHTLYHEFGASL